jgi:class I fructose-bisphosphate aldolase
VHARLNRLFAADGRCFDVAVDHGFFGEPSMLAGIERMADVIAVLAAAGPDAIQLAPGQAPLLQARPGPNKPALVLRTDAANVYGRTGRTHEYLFSALVDDAVGQAVALDAACVVVNLLALPDHAELLRQCIANVTRLRAACTPVGMPLMVEPLAMKPGAHGYESDGTTSVVVTLVRQAAELGADIVKADVTDVLDDYSAVIEAAGAVPLLVRGGGRVQEDALLARTREVIDMGAAGIVYGRNVIQHPDPAGMVRRLMAVVHDTEVAARA